MVFQLSNDVGKCVDGKWDTVRDLVPECPIDVALDNVPRNLGQLWVGRVKRPGHLGVVAIAAAEFDLGQVGLFLCTLGSNRSPLGPTVGPNATRGQKNETQTKKPHFCHNSRVENSKNPSFVGINSKAQL